VPITVTVEELLAQAMNRNFIPVVDGRGAFIGIVTRKAIMQYFADPAEEKGNPGRSGLSGDLSGRRKRKTRDRVRRPAVRFRRIRTKIRKKRLRPRPSGRIFFYAPKHRLPS
jgi:CBS domain containing-hemolysin-like protein